MRRTPNGGAATVVQTITPRPVLVTRHHQRIDAAILPKKGSLSVYSTPGPRRLKTGLIDDRENDRAAVRHNTFPMSPSTMTHFMVERG